MKSVALILLCAAAQATAGSGAFNPNSCPKDWSVEKLLPHRNCNQFYQCWSGKLVVHTCPSDLHFSVVDNRCEWARNVDCTDRIVPDGDNSGNGNDGNDNNNNGGGNSNPAEAPSICAAEGSEDVLVAHEKCNKYYVCNGGKPVALRCPANLLFNPNTDQCDWPQNVKCGDRVVPDGDNSGNGDGGNDNGGSDNGGGDSDDKPSGGGNCNPAEAPSICAAEGSEDVLVAHEKCNKYYVCNGGKPVALRCPANLLFNPNTDQCDWPQNVECGDRVVPDGDNSGNGDGESDNGGSDNGGGDSDDKPSGGGNCNPAEAPSICAAEGSEDVLVAHEKCNKYYVCNGGKPVALRCPANLLFNPNTDQCDWPQNVECGDRVVPDGDNSGNGDGESDNGGSDNGGGDSDDKPSGGGNCNPAEAPSICAAEGSEDVLVAHEKCNKFYVCNGGKPVALRCPANLLFNPNTDQCDWPQNVECGDRVVPDGDNSGNGDGGNDNGGSDNGGGDSDDKPSGGGNCNPAEAPSICAVEGSEDVLVAHEKCNKYYVCNGGKPVALRCPANLLFNPNTDQCDWPQNVECGDRVVPDGDNSGNGDGGNDNGGSDNGGGDSDDKPSGGGNCNPAEAPSICAAEGSEDVLVAHEKCNKYYVCNGGKPVALRCPANLLFNPNTDQCDWPQNVECGDRVVPDGDNSGNGDGESDNGGSDNGGGDSDDKPSGGGNCNPAEAPSICAAEGSEDVLVAHEKCNKFYVCNGGKPVALRCPANLLFNPNTDQCDWPQNVECGDRVVPDGDNSGNGDGGSDNGGSDNGGGDSDDKPSGGGNCNPAEAPSICAAEGSEDVLVAHEKCNKYYVCNGGKPVALRCPANLLFNPNTDQCDWPQNVECGDRVVPDGDNSGNGDGESDNGGSDNGGGDSDDKPSGGGNCNPAEAPSICAAEGSEDVLVAHEKCNKFYVCNGGKPVALRCPANLLFNPNTDQCDWPQNVECGDRVVPDGDNSGNGDGGNDNGGSDNGGGDSDDKPSGGGNCNPAEAPSICAAEGSEDVLVAHEKCNKFYVCNGGKPVALRCPANLLFNPNTDQCDWPQNVECGDRVVPDGDNSGNGDGGSDNGGSDNGGGESDDKPSGGGNCNPAEAPSICAAEGSEDVLVAHEKCNKFYVCNGGKPVALRCPANLLFNPNTDQCDWPQNVECGDRVVPDGDNSGNGDGGNDNGGSDNGGGDSDDKPSGGGNCNPAEAPSICAAEGSEDVLVAHEKCNKFYVCNGGKPVALRCPANLLFNPNTDQCDFPQNVECGDRVVPDGDNSGNGDGGNDNGGSDNGGGDSDDKPSGGGNCNPAEAPSICAAEGSEDVLVAHEKCNKFYVCNGGKPVALRCPANLLFNPNTDQCDWPQNVECGDRVVPDGDNSGNGDGGSDNGGSDNGGGDSDDKPSGGGNCNPAEAPSICAAEGSEDVLVAHEKCNKFYVCNGGKPVALRCPANLLFNPNTDQCDWPQNVECGDRVVPDGDNSGNGDGGNDNGGSDNSGGDSDDKPSGGGNCNPAEAPSICAAEGSEDVLVAHEKCNKFYVCNGGKPVALRCPANLLFNPNTDQCDWPQNVECGDRVVPDGDNSGNGDGGSDNGGSDNGGGDSDDKPSGGGNCNPAEAPSICAAEGSEDVLVAHEKCNKFYVCNGGKPVALRCPANLLFNPNTDQCDFPQNVECGDRVVPDGDNSGNGDGGNDNGGSDNGGGDSDDKPSGGGNCNPAEAPSICAAEGSEDVLVAHEKCNKFYVCNGGKPVALRCPANLLFNPNTDQCDWPQNVECGDRVVPDGDNSGNGDGGSDNGGSDNGGGDSDDKPSGGGNCNPAEAPSICAAEGSEDVLVAHEKCNKFYVCNGGKPVALRCPANLLFNPNTDQCDWPQNVECGDRVVPDGDNSGNGDGGNDNGGSDNSGGDSDDKPSGGGNCNPAEAPSICAAEGSEDVLVAHEKCNKFYVCNGGKPVALRCPANLLFNPNTDQCDWPQNVECGDRVVPDGDNSGNGDGGSDNGGSDNGGGDSDDKPSGGGNCNPAEAPSICAAEGSEDVLVAHEKCNKFYVCHGGKPVALRCPANLLFNPNTDQCDWPQNVECGDRVVPDGDNSGNGDGGNDNGGSDNGGGDSDDKPSGGGNCNPAEAPSICAAEGSEDVLVAHEKCNKYYVCNGGKPVALRCPANLLFNPNTDQCDWPQNVECGDRVVPGGDNNDNGSNGGNDNGGNGGGDAEDKPSGGGNCNPAEAPSICAAEGSEDVLVAHENCNKYYVCNGGKPVALRCPANLLFNPNTDQCDWPQNVQCGDRVVPEGDNNGNGDGGNDNGSNGGSDNGNNGGSGNGGNGGGNADNKPSGDGNCNPAEAPSICAAEGSEDVLVAHEKCNKFYVCHGGKPVALRCPGNLLFNPSTDQCDWPQNVKCGDRVVPGGDNNDNGSNGGNDNGGNGGGDAEDKPSGGGNCNPAEAPSICAAEGSEDVLVAHEKCNKFYVCHGGKPVTLRCPGNLLFNPNTDQCDWPQNVKCGDRVFPDSDNNGNGDGGSDNGGSDNGSNGGNNNGGNGGGDAEDKPSGGGNCNPAEAPSICAAQGSEDVLVAHEKCNKFYVCHERKPVTLRCPGNLLFNPNTDQCDWPENVECVDRVVPGDDNTGNGNDVIDGGNIDSELVCDNEKNGAGNSDPNQAREICARKNSEGVLVAHEKCNQFYICDHGEPVSFDCPSNLLFNPSKDKCEWSHCVDCGQRIITGGEEKDEDKNVENGENGHDDPSKVKEICGLKDSEGVLVAHEKCNKFYVCQEGMPAVLNCPLHLFFNPALNQCDWPENVSCLNRIVPTISLNKHFNARKTLRVF